MASTRGERERERGHRKQRSRPSEDLGYEPEPSGRYDRRDDYGEEDGYAIKERRRDRKSARDQRDYDYEPQSPLRNGSTNEGRGARPRYDVQPPNGATILEGYREDILNEFEDPQSRYNPMNAAHPQSSMLLNINDPIQVHLLVETALWDAKEYEILSPEEVDDLKKQCQSLNQRIQTARQNLAVQSKFRDATRSMSKLYPDKRKSAELNDGSKPKRGLFGNKRNSGQIKEADLERLATEKKCEDLAAELWSLEKRLIEPENRLLKHTAGILQMTHRGPKRDPRENGSPNTNGMPPGSPESMYTYHNARNSIDAIGEEDDFDERSFYRTVDPLDVSFGAFGMQQEPETPSTERSKEHLQLISSTEQKLEDLNSALREVIIKANPDNEASYNPVPLARTNAQGKPTVPGETLQSHLDFLEQGIATLDLEHGAAKRQADEMNASMEDTLEELNREVMGLLLPTHPELHEPPALTGQQTGLRDQLYYFQDIIASVEEELTRAAEIIANPPEPIPAPAPLNSGKSDQNEQMETVLMGLWDIIQSSEEEIRREKQERRQTQVANGRAPADDSDNGSEMGDPNEPFTLQAFSAKVQWLYSSATKLKEHKKVLQRQIKQQRELNNKSDATKDAELTSKQQELEQTKELLDRAERSAMDLQEQLSTVMGQLAKTRQAEKMDSETRANNESSTSSAIRDLQEQLSNARRVHEEELGNANREASERISNLSDANRLVEDRVAAATRDSQERVAELATINRNLENQLQATNEKLAKAEAELEEMANSNGINSTTMSGKMTDHEARIAELSAAVAAAATTRVAHEGSIREKDKLLQDKEKEVEDISMKVAELQTEVTIARAELDGAYGSRAQRAAEVASNPIIQKEIDALTNKNIALQEQIDALQNKNFSLQGEIASIQSVKSPSVNPAEQEAKLKELRKELEETIGEYEVMTKASVEWEKEREKLESEVDKLREDRETLETQLSDEKVRWMGMRSPGGEGPITPGTSGTAANNTSTTVLKNEFKKMMRDSRAENARALRAEQLERRRVEEELRALRKQQGPGRSRLSQSVASSS